MLENPHSCAREVAANDGSEKPQTSFKLLTLKKNMWKIQAWGCFDEELRWLKELLDRSFPASLPEVGMWMFTGTRFQSLGERLNQVAKMLSW